MSFSWLKICVALHCWSQSQVHKTAMSQVLPSLASPTFPGTSPVHFAIYLEQVSLQSTSVGKQKEVYTSRNQTYFNGSISV